MGREQQVQLQDQTCDDLGPFINRSDLLVNLFTELLSTLHPQPAPTLPVQYTLTIRCTYCAQTGERAAGGFLILPGLCYTTWVIDAQLEFIAKFTQHG